MHKFAFFFLAQFIILFNGYAAQPETRGGEHLIVSDNSGRAPFADYLLQVSSHDPAHLYGWKQGSGIDKTDLSEEEEEASSSKKQAKDLHPASGFNFLQTPRFPDRSASAVSCGHHTGFHSQKRYILFEVFRI